MKGIHPTAIFRLSVLGQLASRDRLEKGELKKIVRSLASQTYNIPNSQKVLISEATIERWYYAWKQGGIEALEPKPREDSNQSKISDVIQQGIIAAKKEKPSRSINRIIRLLESNGVVSKNQLSRSSVYRLLKSHQLAARVIESAATTERRRFEAKHAGEIWQGDVLHGPKILLKGRHRKTYLVTFMDDASRLITHSEFCLGETALDIQAVLKQALLKRGLPNRIILDNGSAYRSGDLQAICARLKINLVYCRPYQPQGKGKLERWHSRFRNEFLDELEMKNISSLSDLNARLWAYLEQLYHVSAHAGLQDKASPIERWRKDLAHIRPLGTWATQIDELFYHRKKRHVRKDGCINFEGKLFEVPYQLTGHTIMVVFDPEKSEVKWVESESGEKLGDAVLCDPISNSHRKRLLDEYPSCLVSLFNKMRGN